MSLRATPDAAVVLATADLGSVARLATHLALLQGGALLGARPLEDWAPQESGLEHAVIAALGQE